VVLLTLNPFRPDAAFTRGPRGTDGIVTLSDTLFQRISPRDLTRHAWHNPPERLAAWASPASLAVTGESWLVSFPRPSYMLKFSRSSCLIGGPRDGERRRRLGKDARTRSRIGEVRRWCFSSQRGRKEINASPSRSWPEAAAAARVRRTLVAPSRWRWCSVRGDLPHPQ